MTTKRNAEMAERLAARRAASGLSFNRVAQMVYDRLGAFAPTLETVRTYHDPKRIPEQVNPVLVAALADVYDCSLIDLSETVNEDAKTYADLLKRRSSCTTRELQPAA
jgi:hypothetical protein